MLNTRYSVIPFSMLLMASAVSAAQEEAYELDTIVVTASRTAQSVDESLSSVSVISRDDIERSQAQSVSELIAKVPGVQVNRNGGIGSATSIMIRGASSAQTLVLVDGLRVNAATGGSPDLQYLSPEQIERIEVVRGPGSSLYGADAVGGIVHIITRKGEGDPKLRLKAGIGSENTHEMAVNYGGQSGSTRYNIGASFYETAGFDATNDDYFANSGANLDDDGYRNSSLSATLSHTFDNDLEAGVAFSYADGKNHYDATDGTFWQPYNAYAYFTNASLNGYLSFPVSEAWNTRLDLGYVSKDSENTGDSYVDPAADVPSFFKTKRSSILWQNDIAWANTQLLTVGAEYYIDEVDTKDDYINTETGQTEDSRSNKAVFIQNQSFFNSSDLRMALRHDDNEAYGDNVTGNIAYGYNLPASMRIVASYGTAFRAPTFNDLYFPDTFMPGNPNLKPETSENMELSLSGNHGFGKWQLAAFQNTIEDLIEWAELPSGMWTPSNVAEAQIRGLEASLSQSVAGWNLNTAVTLQDPQNTNLDKRLARRAKQFMTIDADREMGRWSVGGTLYAQGETFEDAANEEELSGFMTVDARIGLKLNQEVKTELKMTNLLDKDYTTASGYNTQSRAFLASVTWTPEI